MSVVIALGKPVAYYHNAHDAGMATGDILLLAETPIGPTETTPSLPRDWQYQRPLMALDPARLSATAVQQPTPQNHSEARCAMLKKKWAHRLRLCRACYFQQSHSSFHAVARATPDVEARLASISGTGCLRITEPWLFCWLIRIASRQNAVGCAGGNSFLVSRASNWKAKGFSALEFANGARCNLGHFDGRCIAACKTVRLLKFVLVIVALWKQLL